MNKIKVGLVTSALLLGTSSTMAVEDLGEITIESSTVNVLESSKTSEVSTVSFIDEQRIEEVGPKQLNEVLNQVPGVTADFQAHEEVEIHIRGVGQQEFMWEDTGVALIIDGVPVYTKSGSYRLNLSDIKSIKVIKGSASYLYGNTATAGAVIITTSRPKGSENKISLSTEFGSYKYRDHTAEVLHSGENYAVNLNMNKRTNDGYWTDSKDWSKSIGGKFTYYISDSSDVTLGIDRTKKYEQGGSVSVSGVDEAKTNPKGDPATSFIQNETKDLNKYFLKYNKDFENGGNFVATIYNYLDKYEYDSSPQDTDLNGDPMDIVPGSHNITEKKQKGLKAEYREAFGNKFAYMLGGELGDIKYTSARDTIASYLDDDNVSHYEGETSYTVDKQKLYALYSEFKYAFTGKFNTTFNIRHDIQTNGYDNLSYLYDDSTGWGTYGTELEKTYRNTSYRFGGVYNVSESNAFFANVSTGFRTPQVDKIQNNINLYDKGKIDSVGNIETQTSMSYEIGNRGKILGHDYEVTLFQIDTKDIIGYEDGTYAMSVGGSTYTTNIGDSRNRGLELSVKSDAAKQFSYNIAYTYLDSEYTKHNPIVHGRRVKTAGSYDVVGNELPRVPHHKLNIYSTYKATPQWRVISEIYAQSEYFADETNFIKMPGYAYLNLQTRYNMTVGGNHLELFAKVNNVFDTHYFRTVYYTSDKNKNGLFDDNDVSIRVDPGRMIYAGIKYSF
ncbi:TonB-dependent receptor [Sulfurovum mangrovi]|uniref:TonB-dependent receptor n=1 Tax=Sulfurovum mangrovi TaxID=2893889 RepID=UPI001E4CD609|nr:TonB-dependent receptor [Sulfurovum mangrovi]UFH59706.1 TonB-dependent receptor [Sulfurovum mangrovi]